MNDSTIPEQQVIREVLFAKPPPGPLELFIRQRQDALAWEMDFVSKTHPETDAEWRALGFKKCGHSWVFDTMPPKKGFTGRQREGKTKAAKAVNRRKARQ